MMLWNLYSTLLVPQFGVKLLDKVTDTSQVFMSALMGVS